MDKIQILPSERNYLPDGRRKVTGHNGTGENTVSLCQTGEIVGSQRREKIMLGGIRENFMIEVASECGLKDRWI